MAGPGIMGGCRHHNPGSAPYDACIVEQEKSDQENYEDNEVDEKSPLMMAALFGVGAWKFEPHGSLRNGVVRPALEIPAQACPVKQCEAQADDRQHHRRDQ